MSNNNTEEIVRHQPTGRRGGEWVTLGLDAYRVPPLGFRAIQELSDDIASLTLIGAQPTLAQLRTVARIAHSAMVRNYPALSEDEVLDMLDMGNFQQVLGAVLAVSGFQQAGDGGQQLGEARASIGAASTPA